MNWWWIRHGPTHAKSMVGWSDLPADLSDTAALSRLRALLPHAPVVSSDLIRARSTADAIADARPRLPDAPALRELHFGDWELRQIADVEDEEPERSRRFWSDPGATPAPGGESWDAVEARVSAFVDRVSAERASADIIAVAHLGVILSQLRRARGCPPAEIFEQSIDPLSLTRLSLQDGRWQVHRVNHSA